MQGSVSKVFTLQTQGPELNSHGSCMKDLKLKKKKRVRRGGACYNPSAGEVEKGESPRFPG